MVFNIEADTVYSIDTVVISTGGIVNYPLKRLDTEYAYSTVEIKNSKLEHKLYQKQSEVEKLLRGAIKQEVQYITHTRFVEKKVEKPIPIWKTVLMYLGGIFTVLIIVAGIYIYFNIKRIIKML